MASNTPAASVSLSEKQINDNQVAANAAAKEASAKAVADIAARNAEHEAAMLGDDKAESAHHPNRPWLQPEDFSGTAEKIQAVRDAEDRADRERDRQAVEADTERKVTTTASLFGSADPGDQLAEPPPQVAPTKSKS